MVTPAAKREVVSHLTTDFALSIRAACRLVNISRSVYQYQPTKAKDDALRARLKALATQHPRFGYLMLHGFLKNEGLVCNKKKTYRLYREEKLQVRTKKRKKLKRNRQILLVPSKPRQRWSMDFVYDQLSSGRRFRVLNVIDDFNRELLGQLTSFSISGHQVARFLTQLTQEHGLPNQIVCDNGTEFTSKAMFFWSQESKVHLAFIQPGKPTQNAFVESFNGKFRNECLNQHWFKTIDHAREIIDQWRDHYNHERPHSSLGYLSPVDFAKQAA